MKYALINGIILDGREDMAPREGMAVLINGEVIEAVCPMAEEFPGYETVDLKGAYVMPGLINLHVHLPSSGKPKKKQSDPKKAVKLMTSNGLLMKVAEKICAEAARTQLMSGVTTIRTMGGVANLDTVIRDKIEKGTLQGPRILAGNMAVSVEGGHMAGSLAYIAHTAEEAAEYVRRIALDKPDVIKLMITGGVLDATVKGEPGVLKMPPELVKAACDEAHRLGYPVAAHVESPEGVKVALQNGVDTIEHGALPDGEILELFKARGAAHVATLSPALPYALFDREVSHISEMEQYNGSVVFEGIVACAKACLEAGVPVGLGTDTGCPYITHYDMWRELNYFRKYCGVSNAFALHTATQVNARIAGISDKVGTVEAGKEADLLFTVGNPLESLLALRYPKMVMARGQLVREPKVKKMPEVEEALDKYL